MITIDFHGYDIDVFYDFLPSEDGVGLSGGIEVERVEYFDCDVTDILDACDKLGVVAEMVEQKLEL